MSESYGIEKHVSSLRPVILDASVFTSFSHCETLLRAGENFFVSSTLYQMLYEEYDLQMLHNTLRHFAWRPPKYLPAAKLYLQIYMEPYSFKREHVEELYPYLEEILLPPEVNQIILDEYSFLKEHSSILMSTKRFAKHLHRCGIVLIDAVNKSYDQKHRFFAKIRGPRWLLGVLLQVAGLATLSQNPLIGSILAGGGTALIVTDP